MENLLEEVKMWDKMYEGEEMANQKYLNFRDSVVKSEEVEDLKKFIQTNVASNKEVNKFGANIILNILKLIGDNLGKTDLEKSSEALDNFNDIKQAVDESIKDYINRFEQIETALKHTGMEPVPKALVLHMIRKCNLNETS